MNYLIDTNVISELRKEKRAHPNLVAWAARVEPMHLFTSVLVLAEIRLGIELKRRGDPVQGELLDAWFLRMRSRLGTRVLGLEEQVGHEWAQINVPDRLPVIDGLLAATAKVHGMTLVTRNIGDVARSGVAVLNPFEPTP